MPNGWSGVLTGGSIIFFTYIGFDSVSTAAEECRNPQRDLPIGIIATLVVCTVLYVAVAVCLTGLVPWQSMVGDAAPVVNALKKLSLLPGGHSLHWIRLVVLLRRHHGHDLFHPRLPARPIARLVLHVPRRPAAQSLLQRASPLPHPGLFHLGRRHSWSPFPPACSTSAPSPTFPTSARSSPSSWSPSASSSCASASPNAIAASSFPAVPSFPRSASSSASCSWPDCPSSPGTVSSSGSSSAWSFISSTAVTAPSLHPTNCRPNTASLARGDSFEELAKSPHHHLITFAIGGTYLLVVFEHRRNPGLAEQTNPEQNLTPDDVAVVRMMFPTTFDDVLKLQNTSVWMKNGYTMPYFPYKSGRIVFTANQGIIPSAQRLDIKKVIKAAAPAQVDDGISHGTPPGLRRLRASRQRKPLRHRHRRHRWRAGSNTSATFSSSTTIPTPSMTTGPKTVWSAIDAHQVDPRHERAPNPHVHRPENPIRQHIRGQPHRHLRSSRQNLDHHLR